MLRRPSFLLSLSFLFLSFAAHASQAPAAPSTAAAPIAPVNPQSFAVQDGRFVVDGKPFQIISGEMHYARIPREYWRDALAHGEGDGPEHHHHLCLLERA